MLAKLVGVLPSLGCECEVVSLLEPGAVAARIEDCGVTVRTLGMRRGLPTPAAILKLAKMIRAYRPHVVQTWMYHADLVGLAACMISGRPPLVWNIRCSDMDFSRYRATTRLTVRACAMLSGFPAAVLTNSSRARDLHRSLGYHPEVFDVIPNGFDLARFRPDSDARAGMRAELGISEDVPVFGHVARFDPMKDHATLLAAMQEISRQKPEARFVLCGDGLEPGNSELVDMVARAGLADSVSLLGRRGDVHRVMAGFDVFCLSSAFGEGFPNVVGEAMACGVPCVVTDVGDCREIVGESGRVCNPRDARSLALGALELLADVQADAESVRRQCRDIVLNHFSLEHVAEKYHSLYTRIGVQGI